MQAIRSPFLMLLEARIAAYSGAGIPYRDLEEWNNILLQ
jgi:hypothetical protein